MYGRKRLLFHQLCKRISDFEVYCGTGRLAHVFSSPVLEGMPVYCFREEYNNTIS